MNLFRYLVVIHILFLICTAITAQTLTYGYDAAGNRLSRTIVVGGQKSMITNNENTGSLHEVLKIEETFTDILGELKITIYPNPNQGQMVVQVDNLPFDVESLIKIFDLTGKLIFEKRNLETYTNVDITNSPNGTYIMTISIDKKISEWKVIKK